MNFKAKKVSGKTLLDAIREAKAALGRSRFASPDELKVYAHGGFEGVLCTVDEDDSVYFLREEGGEPEIADDLNEEGLWLVVMVKDTSGLSIEPTYVAYRRV